MRVKIDFTVSVIVLCAMLYCGFYLMIHYIGTPIVYIGMVILFLAGAPFERAITSPCAELLADFLIRLMSERDGEGI